MKTIIISVLVIVAASIGISNSAYGQPCYPDLPDPILVLEGTEIYSVDQKTFTRYMFDVENYDQFPDEIFTPSPDVDIFDNEGNRLYGFIGLNAPEDLNIIWVAIEVGTEPPPGFYITIVDTECGITYTSNTVSTCYPNLPDPVLALEPEGIEVVSNEIGTFIRYRLDVTNYDQYPVELFTTAPYLPPYNSASRADIDIFDNEGTRLYGFSILGSPSSLNNIWIAFDIGIAPPSGIYITVYDRACENIYTSNTILIPEVSVPSVTTNPVINISTTTANSGGEVNLDGGLPVTARGVCWSESSPPTTSDNITTNGNGIGSFTSDLTGLTPNKTYYVRAYATNDLGTAYGTEESFTTYRSDAITDNDDNYYNIVTIGDQVWMAENLKATTYNDGTTIPLVTDNTEWLASSTPAYCWYNNDQPSYGPTYGALYNWYAVETEKLCPAGWHVPSYDEWHVLFDHLGGYNIAGGKLKATGTLEGGDGLWYDPNLGATNEVGFTALPSGQRIPTNGNFSWINYHTLWWSTSESPYSTDNYYSPNLTSLISNVSNNYSLKETGLSVRCVQNSIPTITTAAVSSITETSALSGGNVTDDGGTTVTARGVCWSIEENPTIDDVNDFFTDEGPGNSTFSSIMDGLLPNTTYFVRAYGVNDIGIAYGNEISFITSSLIDTDYLALVDLYYSTDGDNWTRNDNWLTENVDDWYGVVVSGGRVTGLHLNKNNLTGTLPPSIGDLSELTVLDFWTNNLNGPIPSEIGNLSNLTRLYLNSNELTGPIPVEIGQLTNLTYLYLNGNQLSGTIPDEIASLSSLTILGLGSNQLTGGIPPVLGNMSSLVQLSLGLNPLGGTIPAELGDLDNLEFLILKDNQLSGNIPPEIWGLSNLKQLHVGINNLEGTIPPEIGNLTNLLFLQLYSNQFSGGLPSAIGNLETLIMFNINSNNFSGSVPSEITDLTTLGVINIKDNQFNSLPLLSALTNLESLIIEENMFTFKDIEPNIGVAPVFTYSPQANIETEGNGTVHLGEEVVFTVNAGGTNSEYQWSKNGDELGMPSSDNTLTISPVNLSDAGDYGCYVTNSVAPDLMLQANPETLDVINAIQVINTDDAGPGSLRYAIEFANTHPGEDGIYFRIDGTGPHTIQLETRLPDIHDPVIIDGYTQGGASPNTNLPEDGMNSVLMIELDGSKLVGAEGQGFIIHSGDCRIRGLVLNRFAHRGISMWLGGGNIIEGNYLGTDVYGTTTEGLGIGTFAIEISGSDNNIIRNNIVSGSGGTDPLESNPGIVVIPFENPGYEISSGNQFFGNYIGTDVTGTLPLPNNGAGISIGDSPGNTVGGTDPADRNIIYGGLSIGGNASTTGNRVIGNFIGPDVTGNAPMGPPLMGVVIGGEASENEIGPGNVISGNMTNGVSIVEGSFNNTVQGNFIGLKSNGFGYLGNQDNGIAIDYGSDNAVISNIIAGNTNHGILVTQGDATSSFNNTISQNSIYENGGLGIALGHDGVTMNDENDADNGPNKLQNYPVLNSIGFSPGHVSVSGYLKSEKVTDYHLEFFANMTSDPPYYGEGETYLGSINVQTDNDSGYVFFEDVFPVVGFPGQFITATATDPSGNTSEFSASLGGIKEQILSAMQQPFTYKINEEGLPGIRNGDDLEAIRNSFATWTDIPTADLVFDDGGTTQERYAAANDGINLVTFTDNKFPLPPGVLAISAKTLRIVPGEQVAEILDADIVFNPAYVDGAEYYFGIPDGAADSKIFDIESITTHEIGHAMGLVHTGIPLSTMFYALGTDILNRTLEADDLAWASYRYPGAGVDDAYGYISGQVTYGEMPLGTDPESYPPVAGALVLALNKENFDYDQNNPGNPINTSLWFHTYTDAEGYYKVPVEAGSGGTEYYVHIQPLDGDVFGFDLRPGNISAYIYINTIYTDYPDEMYNDKDGPEDEGDPFPVKVLAGATTTDINLVTNVDTEPPLVEDATASPVDNNGKLITRPEFFIYFNEAVDLNSFTAENCYLEYEVDEVTQTIGGYYDYFDVNSKDVILFKPDELAYDADYILHVKNITDLKNNVDPDYEYIHPKPFRTTKADGNPPKVHQVIPKDGKTGIFITDTILVFFSEPMDETTVIEAFTLSHAGDQDVDGNCYLNPDYDMLTFVPASSLMEGEKEYTVTVDHTAADFQDNTLGSDPEDNFTSNFQTVATAAPLIMYMGPENGELNVTVETPVVVDFSEPIDRNTVTTETFTLSNADGVKVNGSFEFLYNDSRVVFRPDKSLGFSTQYTIELAAGVYGIYDMSEVRLPLDPGDPKRTASFTTAAEFTIPYLEYMDPVSGVDGAVVKVAGSGFDPVPENNVIVFNGSEAVVTDATLHSLTTKVPNGAISGSVPVIVNGIESSNSKYFSIVPQSLNPCAEPIENANTGSRSRSVAIAADAASAYVTNYWDNTVTAIKIWDDGHLEAMDTPIKVGNNPFDIDIDPLGERAYVTNYSSHTVSVIKLDKENPGLSYRSKDISVGVNPYGIAVSPDKKVYVANYESKNISVIDVDPNSGGFDHVVSNVNTGSRNRSIAISQDAALAVVTGDNGVNIIQFAESGNYADAIVTNASAGTRTRDAAIRPDAGLAVVTTEDGDVLVIDIYPGSEYFGNVIANATTGSRSRDVSISQDALFVYISGVNEGGIDVVEVWKLTLGGGIGGGDASSYPNLTLEHHADIPLVDELGIEDGIDPEGIAIDPYGQRLYIVNTSLDGKEGQLKVVRICCGPVAQEKLVGDLFSIIQNLVSSGVLNDGQANALTVKLDKALTDLAKGKTHVAINVLNTLITQILDLMDEGVLTEQQANGLIEKINAIIAELEPEKKSAKVVLEVEDYEVPTESSLGPIYPNPFKHSTTIHYEVSTEDGAPVRVHMSVINNTGQVVAHLVDQVMTPGQYRVDWDAMYHDDRMVTDGIYYVKFIAGQVQFVEKAVVIR